MQKSVEFFVHELAFPCERNGEVYKPVVICESHSDACVERAEFVELDIYIRIDGCFCFVRADFGTNFYIAVQSVSFLLVNRTDFQYTYKICPMFLILIQLLSAARASII